MKSFYARNLADKTLANGLMPWEFIPTATLTDKIRFDKQERQTFYRLNTTDHHFYTFIEPANNCQRPSKDNPPKYLHGLAADYDARIPVERVNEVISSMKHKPGYYERSLGGNLRLVWLFPKPLPVETFDFTVALLQEAITWLNLHMLPALDEGAFTDPSRLLCNGCDWVEIHKDTLPENEVQAWFVKVGRDFRFKPADATVVPLDVVEKGLLEKYPDTFSWPVDFALGSQGPSFWIEGSTSPLSAIVKDGGLFTFSAHAAKPFYSWADILGSEFIKQFATNSIANATKDIFWDGKKFWRKKNGYYASLEMGELQNYFKVECRISGKPDKTGNSAVDLALSHIYNVNHVAGAAPFIFRPGGLIDFMGRRVLNTYLHKVMNPAPAEDKSEWGDSGKFPFLSKLFENLFDPPSQLQYFLAWWKHFYLSGLEMAPMPGQNIYLMGGANVGKTLTNRNIIGRSVGGFSDCSNFLIRGEQFNSELFEVPLWCVDDETVGESNVAQSRFFATWKKIAANQQFKHNKKFEVSCMTEWMGRIICTTNLDHVSSRLLGPMDDTSMDKTSIFRCARESKIVFPTRYELAAIIETELPYLLRWLIDWEPPDYVPRDVRYGYGSFHENTLLDQSHQTSKSAPFKELLIEALLGFFNENPSEAVWRGTITQLLRLVYSNPLNDVATRGMKLEQVSRYLEQIQREGLLKCEIETGELKTRVWVFSRVEKTLPVVVQPAPEVVAAPPLSIFSK